MQGCTDNSHQDDVPHHQKEYQDKDRFLWLCARVPEGTAAITDSLAPADVEMSGRRRWVLHV